MPVYKVNVKWQHEKFNEVDCDTDDSPTSFKALLFSLTKVPPERQKVMISGGILGDSNFTGIKLRNGATIILMGSADKIPSNLLSNVPENFTKVKEVAKKVDVPYGIMNLGNTCYMNGTLQLLFSIPELTMSLKLLDMSHLTGIANEQTRTLLTSMRFLFESLEKTDKAVTPLFFLKAFHSAFPQFATVSNSGSNQMINPMLMAVGVGSSGYLQQDANECWVEIVRVLRKLSTDSAIIQSIPNPLRSIGSTGGWNPIDRYLTGSLVSTLGCSEGDESTQELNDTFSQLSCFIDKDVKSLHTGIRNGLECTLTKTSETLGREAVYKKVSQISRLPGYLCIQFVRFFYKEKEQINAKILKDVKFPLSLDLYEFCTKDLQTRLLPLREKARIEDDIQAMTVKTRKISAGAKEDKVINPVDNPDMYEDYWFDDDLGSNNSGYYELQGVLTHQGRSSSSGHYVSWVKRKDSWFKLDDDVVTQVDSEDIIKLSGGGDWHCAYLLLYGPRRIRKNLEAISTDNAPAVILPGQ